MSLLAQRRGLDLSHQWIEVSDGPELFCTVCCAYDDETEAAGEPCPKALVAFEDAVRAVSALLGTTIRPTIYQLRNGEFVGALTVDPDVAFAALKAESS